MEIFTLNTLCSHLSNSDQMFTACNIDTFSKDAHLNTSEDQKYGVEFTPMTHDRIEVYGVQQMYSLTHERLDVSW